MSSTEICAQLTELSIVRYAEPDLNCTLLHDSESGAEQEADVTFGRDDFEEELGESHRYQRDAHTSNLKRSLSATSNDSNDINSGYHLYRDFSRIFGHCESDDEDSSDDDNESCSERMPAVDFEHFGGTPEKRRKRGEQNEE